MSFFSVKKEEIKDQGLPLGKGTGPRRSDSARRHEKGREVGEEGMELEGKSRGRPLVQPLAGGMGWGRQEWAEGAGVGRRGETKGPSRERAGREEKGEEGRK